MLLLDDTNNLVLFDQDYFSVWYTQTQGKGKLGRSRLVMQNDGNLVLYDENQKVWYTGEMHLIKHTTLKCKLYINKSINKYPSIFQEMLFWKFVRIDPI